MFRAELALFSCPRLRYTFQGGDSYSAKIVHKSSHCPYSVQKGVFGFLNMYRKLLLKHSSEFCCRKRPLEFTMHCSFQLISDCDKETCTGVMTMKAP